MSLTVGSRLGPYEIVAPIGAGGMGEVYRAKDTRLERTVAIKVLPEHLWLDAELRRRFEREAKTISQLSHPHICALHDVGREGETDYLVMEFLEGETLSERLAKGALPFDLVCRYGAEIADALGTAHAAGVVHRDLKPGNAMVTKSGVKLLDFGLAKPIAAVASSGDSEKETASGPLTHEGAVLGTLQYMAPEQLEGRETDARTDIFALGATLYQMATGRQAFEGGTPLQIASAILRNEPRPMAEVAPETAPALDRLVRRCLVKDPEERWQSARDVGAELRFLRSEISSSGGAPLPTRARRVSFTGALPWAIAVAAAAWLALRRPAPELRRVERLSFPTPPLALGGHPVSPAAVLSLDGRRVAFVAAARDNRLLYVRDLDAAEARALPGTEGAEGPFFSPDGLSVGFSTEEPALKRVSVSGGAPETICRAGARIHGGSWCSDGTIVFSAQKKIWRTPASGGEPKALTAPGESRHYFPEFLPGCRAILYSVTDGASASPLAIVAQSLETGRLVTLVTGGSNAHFAPPGRLLYAVNGAIVAAPFDPERLAVTGAALKVVDGVAHGAPQERALGQFSVSAEGTLAFVPGPSFSGGKGELVWVERDGSVSPIKEVGAIAGARLSPDGRRIAYMEVSGPDTQKPTRQIWVYDVERGTTSRVSFEGDNWWPAWTPDGRHLVVNHSSDFKNYALVIQNSDGTGSLEPFAAAPGRARQPESWTPDGRTLLADDIPYPNPGSDNVDVLSIARDADRRVKPLLATPFNESLPFLSPDGRWLAYVSDESGRREVYVRPYPALDAKFQVSADGGDEPAWAPSGRELFYRIGPKMMSVEIAPGESFRPGKPRLLFEAEMARDSRMVRDYDVSPDGRRFLMLRLPYAATANRVNVVLGWPGLLKALAATR